MSNEESDAAVGQMVRRYGDAKKQLATARGEGTRLAAIFKALSSTLETNPEKIVVERISIRVDHVPGRTSGQALLTIEDISPEKLRVVASSAKEAQEVIATLEPHLKELGVIPRG